jgi:methionyl aminopeptidase
VLFKKPNVVIKTIKEIDKMRIAGKAVASILKQLSCVIKPGITTKAIDIFVQRQIKLFDMEPAFLGVKGVDSSFPASACVSVNNEVVHGIPSFEYFIKEGDIVSVDIGVIYEGYYGDAAKTYAVGKISTQAQKLLDVTKLALEKGIEQVLPGNRLGNISFAIQSVVEAAGFSVVRDFVGHGIGRSLHEDPQVPNYGRFDTGIKLLVGMVLAIEPMVNEGNFRVFLTDNNWTVVTADGSLSSHFEHTIAITKNGCEVLTR